MTHTLYKKCFPALVLVAMLALGSRAQARTLYVSPDGDDASDCGPGAEFATLARAVTCLIPGDTLLISNGVYAGGVQVSVEAGETNPLVIRGESLEAIIDGSPEGIDALRIQDAAYVVLENLTVRNAGRAGTAVRFSHHVRISGCLFTDNNTWGIFTSFADDLTVEYNETRNSKVEHGIYHSNSGDRFVIRGNHVHHNRGNGIHLNGDPEIPGGDGVLNEGVVERNHVHHNGAAGGAAINMTHVHDIIVRNNLIHNNLAGGITVYQDTGTFEQGSKRVLITGNTLYYAPGEGRSGVNVQTTSEKVVITGNIFVSGGSRGNIQVNSEHLRSIISDYNLFWGVQESALVERNETVLSLEQWRTDTGNDLHSFRADPLFRGIPEFDFFPLDSSPAIDAAAPLDTVRAMVSGLEGTDWLLARLDSLPPEDFLQKSRPAGRAPDIGAYEFGSALQSSYDFNGDNRFSVADALTLLLKGLRNRAEPSYDIDGDGVWSIGDVITLLRLIIGNTSPRISGNGELVMFYSRGE
ncbi:MAG: hypothetical protein FVQ81_02560 [Candidatus Glassbacteria bacterium]|nr:hypothetical protein [Candidatus Glassbacteria bacterium]